MQIDSMPLDQTCYEKVRHGQPNFPIQFYVDELHKFINRRVPLHWHYECEFFVARGGSVEVQLGHQSIELHPNDGIFICGNVLHAFRQLNEKEVCECPNIVFSTDLIAPHSSIIYQKYVFPFLADQQIPYVILRASEHWHQPILSMLDHIFALLQQFGSESEYGKFPFLNFNIESLTSSGFEMQVQCLLSEIWQTLIQHRNVLPRVAQDRQEFQHQLRIQSMISYIQQNYMHSVTLQDISKSANISKSEAARCFHTYMKCSPIEYLLQYRLEAAQKLLHETSLSIHLICLECGFNSCSYFIKMFKRKVGMTPNAYRKEFRA